MDNFADLSISSSQLGMAEQDHAFNSGGSVSSFDPSWDTNQNSGSDARLMSQEGVFQLTKDLRKFSEALTALKAVFLDERERSMKVLAHERLGELLNVLKTVVGKYDEINSTEILNMARELIKYVKEYEYDDEQPDVSPEIFRAINSLAMAFSNSVSECLMGDMHVSPRLAVNSSQSFESADASESRLPVAVGASEPTLTQLAPSEVTIPPALENVDSVLHSMDTGLEMAFDRAKLLSKYLNELLIYVKKKAALEMEHAKSLLKLCQSTKPILSEQSFLPFQSLYCTALDHDRDYAGSCQVMYQNSLLQSKFIEPLTAKKNEYDKKRKQLRETWTKEKRRSEDAVLNMKKAKQQYQTKVQEYQKAKEAAIRAEGEQQNQQFQQSQQHRYGAGMLYPSVGKMEKKKKLEEDTNLKASQAELNYKASVNEANRRLRELDKNKVVYLQQLRDLNIQCDATAKTVSIAFFQHHYQLFAPLPVQFQAMCEDAKLYQPGYQYSDYIRNLPSQPHQERVEYRFEPCTTEGAPYLVNTVSDTGSSSGHSMEEVSPSASPGDLTRQRDVPVHGRRLSTEGSLSSEEVLEENVKDFLPVPAEAGLGHAPDSSPVAFRHQISKQAAKVASNVREAFKASKKVAKSNVFGVDFSIVAQEHPDGIPFIVKRCVAEIDNRALVTKGVYRINGVKNRVDKVRILFENQSFNIDLSQYSPHDISGVLKLFLRELPEPLLHFELYDEFLQIAKDYQQLIADTNDAARYAKEEGRPNPPPPTREKLDSFVVRIRDTVAKLPQANRNTLQYLISHLTRVSSHSKENKMTASNLAIVFGPTLMRRQTLLDGNESLNMLIDMPYQSRIVEMLIEHKDFIFGTHSHQAGNIFPFPGFEQAPSSFSPENVDENALTPDSAISEGEDVSLATDMYPTDTNTSSRGEDLLDYTDVTVDSSERQQQHHDAGTSAAAQNDLLPPGASLNELGAFLRHSPGMNTSGFFDPFFFADAGTFTNDVDLSGKNDVEQQHGQIATAAAADRRPRNLELVRQSDVSDVSTCAAGSLIGTSPKLSRLSVGGSPDCPSTPSLPEVTVPNEAPGVPPRNKSRKSRKGVEDAENMLRSGMAATGNIFNRSFSGLQQRVSEKRKPLRKTASSEEFEESTWHRATHVTGESSGRKLPPLPPDASHARKVSGCTSPQLPQALSNARPLSSSISAQTSPSSVGETLKIADVPADDDDASFC